MLRITTHDSPEMLTVQLEGRLAGPWVGELKECWEGCPIKGLRPTVRIDLTAVSFVDTAGKELLAAMHRQGAELVAAGCWMRAVVAEITGSPTT